MKQIIQSITTKAGAFYHHRALPPFGYYSQKANLSQGILAVDVSWHAGFFAHMFRFLGLAEWCRSRDIIPVFKASSPQYLAPERGDNWFRYFYDLPRHAPKTLNIDTIRYWRMKDGPAWFRTMKLDPTACDDFSLCKQLIDSYYPLNSEMSCYIDNFCDEHFRSKSVLGIHYRGTDKREAPRISYKETLQEIRKALSCRSFDAIFISSDERDFPLFCRETITDIPVIWHEDSQRSSGKGIHITLAGDAYKKGFEALVNAVLLSRCDCLIKTASLLSAWSVLMNPTMPVYILNAPYQENLWFPESHIVQSMKNKTMRDILS
jgi:hypothetical protein